MKNFRIIHRETPVLELQSYSQRFYLRRDSASVFQRILRNFSDQFIYKTPAGNCLCYVKNCILVSHDCQIRAKMLSFEQNFEFQFNQAISIYRYTNADLKIFPCIQIHIKIIPWKLRIHSRKNSRFICL